MKWFKLHIIISCFCAFYQLEIKAQQIDSVVYKGINSTYDSLVRDDINAVENLFYKHDNNIPIVNLGPFGSNYYYPSVFFLYQNNLLLQENRFYENYFSLDGIKPFTNISYLNASRKEQIISIKHLQQLGKQFRFDFELNKISSPGAFVNQEANNTLFKAELMFKSIKSNYEVIFNTEIKRDFFELNGGLVDEKDFENASFDSERSYDVHLSTSNSYLKRYMYGLDQSLNLFRFSNDSITSKNVYVRHNIGFETSTNLFYDNEPMADIYSNIYIDSVSTIDSIFTNNISNKGFFGVRNSTTFFEVLYQYDLLNYYQSYGLDTSYSNSYGGFVIGVNKDKFKLDGILKYGMEGYRKGDLLAEVRLIKNAKKYRFNFNVGYFLTEPDLKFVNYTSNHFHWKNYDFNKQSMTRLKLNFEWTKPQLEFIAETKIIENALYFDSLAQANQFGNNLSMTSVSLSKKYKLLNFHFKTGLVYQITSNSEIAPLPEIVGRQLAYYQKRIFKGALKIQLGVGASYSTEYYGYSFMPALSEFYVQGNKKLGYYPSVDLFLNTHLKRAQIFLKYEHINSGRSLSKSYLVPGYPQLNRSLKFGVSWNLIN